MDRRLATIFCQGFDDCNSLASAVKVQMPSPSLMGPALRHGVSLLERWRLAAGTPPAAQHAAPVRLVVTVGVSPGRSGDALEHRSQCLFLLQLVHMFASLLERPLIKAEVSPCYSALLGMFSAELDNVKALYDAQTASPLPCRGGPPVNKNMPPVAGQLKWALELQQRLEGPHRDLFAISHPYVQVHSVTPWG